MSKINKPELVASVVAKTGLSKADVLLVVDSFIGEAVEHIVAGDRVHIHGLGDFFTQERSARIGRNPQLGTPVEIAASVTPKFKAASGLKDAVNK